MRSARCVVVPGLGLDEAVKPDVDALRAAIGDAELVVVENLLSLPINPRAGEPVAEARCGVVRRFSITTTCPGSGSALRRCGAGPRTIRVGGT